MLEQNLPSQTTVIFERLSKGKFISALSRSDKKLFEILENEDTFWQMKGYFSLINFSLERAEGYFYFSKTLEMGAELSEWERKVERLNKYVDVVSFLYGLEQKPIPGIKFRPTQVAEECANHPILKVLLDQVKTKNSAKTNLGKVKAIAEELADESFFEKLDAEQENYLILDSFSYLETIIDLILPIEKNPEMGIE